MQLLRKCQWFKVSKSNPCSKCGREDWCTFSDDGAVCCMRVQSTKPMKNGGWLHKSGDKAPVIPYVPKPLPLEPPFNAADLWQSWRNETDREKMIGFAESLDVDPMALHLLGCAWGLPHNAWAFPMKNPRGDVVGIRLRNVYGEKWAVKGSKVGLFLPESFPGDKTLFILEGPTDTSAALTLGLSAIGRPSCQGCEDYVLDFMKRNRFNRAIIVSDNDDPGLLGAQKLQKALKVPSCIWVPPSKDLREFLKLGGTPEIMHSILKNLVWNIPK